jgi:hypothetical protein
MTVKEFAREQGYDDAISLGKWRGFDAYEPVFDGDVAYVGPPLMILVKGKAIRMSTPEEAYQQMDGK